MNTENNEEFPASKKASPQEQGGYGSPAPEDEMPGDAATEPGSPDPTLQGRTSDEADLANDASLGAPDKNFFENEDAGSDGEPGAGRLGGTDEQFREELGRSEPTGDESDTAGGTPLEAPSTDAPLEEGNSGPVSEDRESFSSESDEEAAGGEDV